VTGRYDAAKRAEYGERFLALIRQVRALRRDVDSPALESCLREMEYANFFALMHLGVEDAVSPEAWDEEAKEEAAR
jgi:hypothetical protein